jgi:uncharacterized protein
MLPVVFTTLGKPFHPFIVPCWQPSSCLAKNRPCSSDYTASFIEIGTCFAHPFGMRWFALIMFVLAGSFAGCEEKSPPPEAGAAQTRPGQPALPTHAQGQLQTIRLWLGPEELRTELALTQEQEQTGMMFRTNLAENAGMLFVLPAPQQASFWMKNCPLPLSAAYMDPGGTILEIHDLQAQDTNEVVAAARNVLYVLEVNQGWFLRHHIGAGTLVRTELGSLSESFTRRRR